MDEANKAGRLLKAAVDRLDRAPYALAKAKRILREFENAVRDDEMRGSYHPDDRDAVHERYKVLKERMLLRLTEYVEGQ